MKYLFSFLLCILFGGIQAQKIAYDLMNYAEPKDWKKTTSTAMVKYEKVDKKTGGWCQIAVYKSVPTKGSVEADFSSEWTDLVVKHFPNVQGPAGDSTIDLNNGWKLRAGMGSFTFNNAPGFSLLTTYSGYNTYMSILANTNKQELLNEVYNFIGAVSLNMPANTSTPNTSVVTNPTANSSITTNTGGTPVQNATSVADGFKYTTTTFNDGWTSVLQTDWVEVTKGDVQMLIHYNGVPNEQYESDRMVTYKKAWDNIIVPKYTRLTNYEYLSNNYSYIPVYMMGGSLVDKSGKSVFVVLFRSGGRESNWIEFIFPNRKRFTEVFGIDQYDQYTDWKAMAQMVGCNRFAVAASDLKGTWTNSFSGMTQYVNVYTGLNAGATAHSSAQEYVFDGINKYSWNINVASGVVGNLKFQNAKSGGNYNLPTNWQLHFSDIENKPRDYPVYFSAVKGARVLWIDGVAFVKK